MSEELTPIQVFEHMLNNYLADQSNGLNYPEVVGFLELKLIELKEHWSHQIRNQIKDNELKLKHLNNKNVN